jgi:hypothetical protein
VKNFSHHRDAQMDYLVRLKNLKTSRVGPDSTAKTLPELAQEISETPAIGTDKTDTSPLCSEQKIAETPELEGDKSAKTLAESPSYICRCPQCGGTHWGQIGTQPDGIELWGCLDCAISPASAHGDMCPECDGANIITDQAGKYCVGCRRRPWERKPAEPESEPKHITVRWGSERGWLELTNPVTNEVCEIVAKGAPRWVFDQLKKQ